VAALAGVLFFVSAPLKRRRKQARKAAAAGEPGAATESGAPRPAVPEQAGASGNGSANGTRRQELEPSRSRPAKAAKSKGEPVDDDMREVEEILRRRGIN
jgi:hypothetical protein